MTEPKRKKTKEDFIENDRRRSWRIEKIFENVLWSTRYLVLFAVISSIVAAFILFVTGTYDVVRVVVDTISGLISGQSSAHLNEDIVGTIIGSIDIFLIAVVLLIFSFGLYELFISHIDAADTTESSNILEIASLDVLKDKIGQVIIMALIVKFFQVILSMKLTNMVEMLIFAGCVAALALALFLLHLSKKFLSND